MEKFPVFENGDPENDVDVIDINREESRTSEEGLVPAKENIQTAQEVVFKSFIESRLYFLLEDGLIKNGYSTDEINEIRERLNDFSVDEKKRILSLTHESKNRVLKTFKEKIQKQGVPASELIDTLKKLSDQFGFEVAYHCSSENIRPVQRKEFTGQSVEVIDSWKILGTEMDHRFEDKKMAYFSFDYEHLYRVKNPRYLYIVRVRDQQGTGYHTNIGNNWGTAQGLDVIDQLDIKDVDRFMTSVMGEYKNESEMKKDAA